ncbi:formylmethanofuran dehydrogenase subunit C [Methanoregula sp.]|jgi:formylmethanofuran dehydrogenase subunit C|uniref:formylmethanofuran dehydrogenase subunit C n=1 Tax=Methanoregula sp. TaxID=2052170 RepID=UPI0035655CB6
METVTITMKNAPALYLEADNVSPDAFAGKSAAQIAELSVHEGNTTSPLGKYFEVTGNAGATAADTKIVVKGDVKKVKYLGFKMTAGELVIEGNTDLYVGAWMTGGKIFANGDVAAFAGLALKGGEITIEGNAGNYLGAAYRGDWRGMSGGRILVKGNAGSDIGMYMLGGEIVVNGNIDVHALTHAEGGRLVVKGNAKSKVGGQMVDGTIFILGTIDLMMPGFKYVDTVEQEVDGVKAKFAHFIGDMGERHKKKKGQVIYGNLYTRV